MRSLSSWSLCCWKGQHTVYRMRSRLIHLAECLRELHQLSRGEICELLGCNGVRQLLQWYICRPNRLLPLHSVRQRNISKLDWCNQLHLSARMVFRLQLRTLLFAQTVLRGQSATKRRVILNVSRAPTELTLWQQQRRPELPAETARSVRPIVAALHHFAVVSTGLVL